MTRINEYFRLCRLGFVVIFAATMLLAGCNPAMDLFNETKIGEKFAPDMSRYREYDRRDGKTAWGDTLAWKPVIQSGEGRTWKLDYYHGDLGGAHDYAGIIHVDGSGQVVGKVFAESSTLASFIPFGLGRREVLKSQVRVPDRFLDRARKGEKWDDVAARDLEAWLVDSSELGSLSFGKDQFERMAHRLSLDWWRVVAEGEVVNKKEQGQANNDSSFETVDKFYRAHVKRDILYYECSYRSMSYVTKID